MKRIICVTGSRGSGKSTAVATYAPPNEIDRMICLDTEDSMSDLVGMGFKHIRMYDRLRVSGDILDRLARMELSPSGSNVAPWVDEQGRNALVKYYEYLVQVLNEEVTQDKYRYLVIDTIEPIEAAMTAAVESGRRVFGWGGDWTYGRRETQGVRPLYEGLLEAISQRGVETVLIASHLKTVWVDDKPVPGKVRPGGRTTVLSRLSSAMFWLVDGTDPHGAPAALVLKARMGEVKADGGYWKTRRTLPRRLPVFTWQAVDNYKSNPPDLSNPAPGEQPSESELQMMSELLSDEQMRLMVLGAEIELADKRGGGMIVRPEPVKVITDNGIAELVAAGKSNKEIVEVTGMSLPDVIKARKGIV